jgi:hypothetical protein
VGKSPAANIILISDSSYIFSELSSYLALSPIDYIKAIWFFILHNNKIFNILCFEHRKIVSFVIYAKECLNSRKYTNFEEIKLDYQEKKF